MTKITLVIPCYNEEVNLQKGVLDKVGNYVQAHRDIIKEVIIVDDGSSDESVSIIKANYEARFPFLKLIEKEHEGKAQAIIRGINDAKAEWVVFIDMDLATPIEEVEKVVTQFESGCQVVIGSRAYRRKGAPFTRKLQSQGMIFLRNALIGLKGISDTQCGCKGFRRDVALRIISRLQVFNRPHLLTSASVSAAFDIEFLFVAQRLGYTIKEVPVEWTHAESKRVSLFKDSIETIRDLLTIRWNDITGKYR